jgi:hypothetical protein
MIILFTLKIVFQKVTEFRFIEEDYLSCLWNDMNLRLPGLQFSYYYLGTPLSYFAPHVEDMNLPSVNFHILGAPKQW